MTSLFPPFAFVELVSPYNKKNTTCWLEDMNFMFSWQEQHLTRSLRSLVRYCSCHSNIKFISSRHRVISSIYCRSNRVKQWKELPVSSLWYYTLSSKDQMPKRVKSFKSNLPLFAVVQTIVSSWGYRTASTSCNFRQSQFTLLTCLVGNLLQKSYFDRRRFLPFFPVWSRWLLSGWKLFSQISPGFLERGGLIYFLCFVSLVK